jgi:ribosomal protein S6--L-glutamate ligase
VLVQKFVAESKGRDIRAFVVGDRVVAAARRVAQAGEFRRNLHRGGSAEAVQLDEAYETAAVRSAQIVGLKVAGVDMLEGNDGPAVMEVNSTAGLQGIETSTGIDVAGAIIDYVRENVRMPDVDLRQRLTISRGYGVAEIPVNEGSELLGKTIATCGLAEQDVQILTVHRGGKVVPNPRADREIEAGDRLLCYGKKAVMQSFVPEVKPPRVRKLPKSARDAGIKGE